MSRYLVEGVIRDLVSGKSVAIVGNTRREALREFDDIVNAVIDLEHDAWEKIIRRHGEESARLWDGTTLCVVTGDARSLRGCRIDVAVLLGGLRGMNEDKRHDLIHALQIIGAELLVTD